eukprot:4158893-Pleurochrysis_carterae.AAC.1
MRWRRATEVECVGKIPAGSWPTGSALPITRRKCCVASRSAAASNAAVVAPSSCARASSRPTRARACSRSSAKSMAKDMKPGVIRRMSVICECDVLSQPSLGEWGRQDGPTYST